MKVVSLFAGGGGLDLGFQKAGFEVIWANEFDTKILDTYRFNHPNVPLDSRSLADIASAEIPDSDGIIGGPPCFVAGILVATQHKYVKIEELSLTDMVLTHTGQYRKILNLQRKMYHGTFFSIKTHYHAHAVTCTTEHPFYARVTGGRPQWTLARDLTNDHFIGFPIMESTVIDRGEIAELLKNIDTNRITTYGMALAVQQALLDLGVIYAIESRIVENSSNPILNYSLVKKVGGLSFLQDGYVWFPIKQITSQKFPNPIWVYNLEVDQDNSYCVENLICHNCQAWSSSGKNQGFQDKRGRGQIFLEYLRVIGDKKPKFFLIENVEGLLRKTHRASLEQIVASLNQLGYEVKYQLLNALQYQVPQDRWRVFFVGIRHDLRQTLHFSFPEPNPETLTLKDAIWDLRDQAVPYDRVVSEHSYLTGPWSTQFMSRNRVRRWEQASFTIPASGRHVPVHPQAPIMVRMTADDFRFVEGSEELYRRFTLRECARIQTFPDTFELKVSNILDGYKILGNAVPVNLAWHIARQFR